MTVSFELIAAGKHNDCTICLGKLLKPPGHAMAHARPQNLWKLLWEKEKPKIMEHEAHKKCITRWVRVQMQNNRVPTCPHCHSLIQTDTLIPPKTFNLLPKINFLAFLHIEFMSALSGIGLGSIVGSALAGARYGEILGVFIGAVTLSGLASYYIPELMQLTGKRKFALLAVGTAVAGTSIIASPKSTDSMITGMFGIGIGQLAAIYFRQRMF